MVLELWDFETLRLGTSDLGAWDWGLGTWSLGLGTWYLGLGAWDLRLRTRSLLGTRELGLETFGTLGLWDLGLWDLDCGTWDSGLVTGDL